MAASKLLRVITRISSTGDPKSSAAISRLSLSGKQALARPGDVLITT